MREPKRYYCGAGEGMFEDDKKGHWVEYSEHKTIVDALTKQLLKHDVVGRSEQLPQNSCTLNQNTCGKGSGCKYPHCHL